MNTPDHDFGQYLKKLRKAAGLTVNELAEKVSVSQPYISNIENGKRGAPSLKKLKKFAEPLGVSYQHLMYEAGYWDLLSSVDEKYTEGDLGATLHKKKVVFGEHELTDDDKKLVVMFLKALVEGRDN
ncbi:helix-turn-helix domain-containing protein [Shouchella lonarensis]|uniref:Helix-turn-helix n=1 Tax=Shouchella lonarensis TaxID=1464122 RepID=A0A1G6IJ25_9BACI|nr:helix-turn-helix transcriptional regulator [Shouchella lonarensis]SDC05736.1 Helix-turn-helix [Shouchella lonarensis]